MQRCKRNVQNLVICLDTGSMHGKIDLVFLSVFCITPLLSEDACTCKEEPRDCQDIYASGSIESGVYHVTPVGAFNGFAVYCNMSIDNGNWTVIHRRIDDSVSFNKTWSEFVRGFGNWSGNFWLGLRQIHMITSQGHYELRVDLESWEAETKFAKYDVFRIGDSLTRYQLAVDGHIGDAGDAMARSNGQPFATADKDDTLHGCVSRYEGAWWHESQYCNDANLNGLYLEGEYDKNSSLWAKGMIWRQWKGFEYSLKEAEMKIRRV